MHVNSRDPLENLRPVATQELEVARGRPATAAATEPLSFDVYRVGDELRIDFDVPGVEPDAISLSLQHSTLTVTVWRELPTDDRVQVIAHGRRHGTFRRSLLLPDHWDVAGLTAGLENGVLRVTAPWRHVVARPVEVTVSGGRTKVASLSEAHRVSSAA